MRNGHFIFQDEINGHKQIRRHVWFNGSLWSRQKSK